MTILNMFSRKLCELDKNTVQYMIDAVQETIGKKRSIIDKPEQESRTRICDQFQTSEEQIRELLD